MTHHTLTARTLGFLRPFRTAHSGDSPTQWPAVLMFAAAVCGTTAAVVGLGYVATREWVRNTDLLVERRATEALALAGSALNRDMKGAWTTLIVPINGLAVEEDPPYTLLQPVARVFARFPYVESFVVWKDDGTEEGRSYAFNRTDRQPTWDASLPTRDPFPVTLLPDPLALRDVVRLVRHEASGSPFLYRDVTIGGANYQFVAHILYAANQPSRAETMAAFTVNLDWVKREYFMPLLNQVARIGGNQDVLVFSVFDDQGRFVAGTSTQPVGLSPVERHFPLLFMDSTLVPFLPDRPAPEWSIQVMPAADDTLQAALLNAQRTFVLLALAAAVSVVALFLTIRAVRQNAVLASIKSELGANVTHEMKTPLALIRLVGDTLAQNRYQSADTVAEYAQLLSIETSRLSRTIDHLLACARYSSPESIPPLSLVPTDVGDLVECALEQFRPVLEQREFELTVDVAGLPEILADRDSMIHMMETLIDNAIKYSDERRRLTITGRMVGNKARITFADAGVGIPDVDLPHVFDRFYRAQNTKEGGSGLGLSIARRIVESHGGTIQVTSQSNQGTQVNVAIPVAATA